MIQVAKEHVEPRADEWDWNSYIYIYTYMEGSIDVVNVCMAIHAIP